MGNKPFYQSDSGKLYLGDCLEVLKDISDNSVDLMVTDPPYGIGFMGKEWDKALPSIEIWKECLRVLKPGAFAFIMSGPRQDCLSRMIISLEEAGLETGFTSIYHVYAQGFPKSMNIGRMVDKRNGRKYEDFKRLGNYLKKQREKLNISSKEITKLFPSKTGRLTGCLWNWENGENVPILSQWAILKEKLDLDDRFDELIKREEAEREVIGKRKSGIGTGKTYAFTDNNFTDGEVNITKPTTSQAKALDGSYAGFQPKPAVEIILVVMKPLSEKGYTDQALKNRKGVTWLDDCRIPFERDDTPQDVFSGAKGRLQAKYGDGTVYGSSDKYLYNPTIKGRFPSNLLCSNDILNNGVNHKSGGIGLSKDRGAPFGGGKPGISGNFYSDSGSFSRYFDLDAWWKKKTEELPPEVQRVFPFLIIPKSSKSEKNKGLEDFKTKRKCRWNNAGEWQNLETEKYGNIHPTVKPMKLFSYLITLGSREGDIVLDPFMGSGTSAIACELLNRKWIGIELQKEYCKIAKARIRAWIKETKNLFNYKK